MIKSTLMKLKRYAHIHSLRNMIYKGQAVWSPQKNFKEVQYMNGFAGASLNNSDYSNACGYQDNYRFSNTPFNSEVVTYAGPPANGGGDCALIHEQFAVNFTRNLAQTGPQTIYTATRFIRCQDSAAIFPFGTIIARNLSAFPITIIISGDTGQTRTIPPNSEIVIVSNSIGQVDIDESLNQNGQARLLLLFDLYYPAFPAV